MCCCSTRIVQIGGGGIQPFSFEVTAGTGPSPLGPITSGPFTVDNLTNRLHFWSTNTIDFNITTGSANVFAETRLDPNINNILTASAAGLLVDGSALPSGVNLYNSDGTITDPVRVATLGLSTMTWDAVGIVNSTVQTHNANVWQAGTQDIVSGEINYVATTSSQVITEANSPSNDIVSRSVNTVFGAVPLSSSFVGGASFNTELEQGFNYFDFRVNAPNYFELRLNGNAGNVGEVLTSQGSGFSSPIWAPVTVTANSLDNLFFSQNIDWDFQGFDWNILNINDWTVGAVDVFFNSNTFTVSSPIVCFTGITQNDALARILAQDAGGCISWRDVSTIGGGANIYSADGTISDPTRTVTIGDSVLEFQAYNGAGTVQSVAHMEALAMLTWTFDTVNLRQNTVTTDSGSASIQSDDGILPAHATVITYPSGAIELFATRGTNDPIFRIDAIDNSFNFDNIGAGFFELRLAGNAGALNEVLTSSGSGASPVWGSAADAMCNLQFSCSPTWDFSGFNTFAWTNIANFSIDAPIICLSGITQNNALTRILAMNASGCLSWRDAATLGGGGGLSLADSGLSVFGGTTVRLGGPTPGSSPLVGVRSINMNSGSLSFESTLGGMVGAPSGQSSNLSIGNNYGGVISGNAYDFQNPFPVVADFSPMGFATWSASGVMRRVDHDQMPYKNRLLNVNTTLATDDSVVEIDTTTGPITITIPAGTGFYTGAVPSSGQGKYFTIKKITGTNPVTIVVSGGGLIEGVASKIIRNINDSLTIQATSATEYIITESHLSFQNTPAFADDIAAGIGGLLLGDRYQTDGTGANPLNVPGIMMLKQ